MSRLELISPFQQFSRRLFENLHPIDCLSHMVDTIRKFHSEVLIRILEVILTIYPLLPPLVITEIRKILNSRAGCTPDDF